MALGIFAFAIIPVIGLLGTGLKASKESVDASTTTRIFRKVEAILSSESPLLSTPLYFSNEGELTDVSGAIYQAVVSPVTPSDVTKGLLVRKVWQIKVVNAAAPANIFSTRAIQVARDISANDFR